jgi:hypothetical protein
MSITVKDAIAYARKHLTDLSYEFRITDVTYDPVNETVKVYFQLEDSTQISVFDIWMEDGTIRGEW